LEIKQVYRLREKISYHAVKVFAVKSQPEVVAEWLKTSLREHNLGLTNSQWVSFQQNLSSQHQQILTSLRAGESIEIIAKNLKLKTNQVVSEWSQIYLAAQDLRTG
jgi:DNA-binding NarL/FixJ family response regulator